MSLLRNIASGLRSLFRKDQVDRELDEELGAYLEMEAAEKMKEGMSRKDAVRTVRLERGSLEITKEVVRSGGWESLVDTLWRDLLFAVRMLRRNPGSTAAVVIALARGIGLNTTVFSFVNALLLRPPEGVKAPEELREIWMHNARDSGAQAYLP
ncbi:MAG: permease, partial [Acidobacteria bacterium]